MAATFSIRRVVYSDTRHAAAVVQLLDAYASDWVTAGFRITLFFI